MSARALNAVAAHNGPVRVAQVAIDTCLFILVAFDALAHRRYVFTGEIGHRVYVAMADLAVGPKKRLPGRWSFVNNQLDVDLMAEQYLPLRPWR